MRTRPTPATMAVLRPLGLAPSLLVCVLSLFLTTITLCTIRTSEAAFTPLPFSTKGVASTTTTRKQQQQQRHVTTTTVLSVSNSPQQQAKAAAENASPPAPSAASTESTVPTYTMEVIDGIEPTDEWELDCYSRPVMTPEKKKLWEVLITDSNGSFRVCREMSSNKVNSRELRRVVEEIIDEAEEKPTTIRFFRGAMYNMINIALSELDVESRPSRCTFALAQWLEERNRDVYPNMEGYKPTMANAASAPAFLQLGNAAKLPDALRGEKYAFVSLPLAEFKPPNGGVNKDNIGVGKICPIDPTLPADAFVQGIVILTQRAKALASWLAGTEVSGFKCDLRKRQLTMNAQIDTSYLVAKLDDVQRAEGAAFEEGKDNLNGLHFVSVQKDEDDDPAGFWLLRDIPENL